MSSDDNTILPFIDMVREAIVQGCSRVKQLPCFLLWLFKIKEMSIRTMQRRMKDENTTFFKIRKMVVAELENDDKDDIPDDITCQNKPSHKGKIGSKGKGKGAKYVGDELTIELLKHYTVQGLKGKEEVNPAYLNSGSRLLELEKKVEPPKDGELEEMIDLLRKSRSNLPQPPEV